jgi:hypothetical protein
VTARNPVKDRVAVVGIGMPVEVVFEPLTDTIALPKFRRH